jgi:hypothetical protein
MSKSFHYSEGEKEGIGVEDLGFFCSLMCFVPWAKFIAVADPENSDAVSESGASEDSDVSMMPSWSGDRSQRALMKSPPPSTPPPSHEDGSGWNVFSARRRSSIDGSSELASLSSHSIISSKPKPKAAGGAASRHGSPSSVTDSSSL